MRIVVNWDMTCACALAFVGAFVLGVYVLMFA